MGQAGENESEAEQLRGIGGGRINHLDKHFISYLEMLF